MSAFAFSLASPSRVSYASQIAKYSLWSFTCAVRSACVFVMCISLASVCVFVNLCVVLWVCRVSRCRRGVSVGSTFFSRRGECCFVCLCVWLCVCRGWAGTQETPTKTFGGTKSWGLFLAAYLWVRRTGRRRLVDRQRARSVPCALWRLLAFVCW